jgi:2,4-dienoyl-CoA reductase (NADPH2)
MTALNTLFSPIKIGKLEIKNRIVMAPMTVDYANADETPSDRQLAYYSERAKGGAGLITLEVCTVDADHRYQAKSLGLYADHLIEPHKKLVDAIHAHGAKVFPQIAHTGPESLAPFFRNMPSVGPSVVRTPTTMQVCRELALEEIPALIEMYGDACVRAQKAGYDGIELHAAHSYMLLGSFLSPLRNHRNDAYSGRKLEGRMKLLLEVIANIRQKCGADYPIVVRLSGYEREAGGREINDTQRMAPLLVAAGVDGFHVSGGVTDNNITQLIPGTEYQQGYNVAMAAAIRQVVDVPVMVVGRNIDPVAGEKILQDDHADMVVMGRALFADSELPNKAKAGLLNTIRTCTSCEDCVDTIFQNIGVHCAINARCGREAEFPLIKTTNAKNILIIGGGPAGMEAARIACEQGHAVTLYEKSSQLGGLLSLASTMHRDNYRFLDYLRAEMQRLPVNIKLDTEITPEFVRAQKADAVIIATGSNATTPQITTSDSANVVSGMALSQLIADRFINETLGERVAIIGSGIVAVELAEFLAKKGKIVNLVSSDNRLAGEVGKKRRGEESRRLDTAGVIVNTGVQIDSIANDGVHITVAGKARVVLASSVLIPDVYSANTTLIDALQDAAPIVTAIGDCTGFGLIKKAVQDATVAIHALN